MKRLSYGLVAVVVGLSVAVLISAATAPRVDAACACQAPLFISLTDGTLQRACKTPTGYGAPQTFAQGVKKGPITFGPDGKLYVLTQSNPPLSPFDTVVRYSPVTGALLDTFVAPGPGNGGLAGDSPQFEPLHFGHDGNLYIVSRVPGPGGSVQAKQLKRYRGDTGAFIDDFGPALGGLAPTHSFKFGPIGPSLGNGYLFVAENGSLTERDPSDGHVVRQCVSPADLVAILAAQGVTEAFPPSVTAVETSQVSPAMFIADGYGNVYMVRVNPSTGQCSAFGSAIDAFSLLYDCFGGSVRSNAPYDLVLSDRSSPFTLIAADESQSPCGAPSFTLESSIDAMDLTVDFSTFAADMSLGNLPALVAAPIVSPPGNFFGVALEPDQPDLACDDNLSCTIDSCTTSGCVHTTAPGTCLIGGVCYRDGDANPANQCQQCDSASQRFVNKTNNTICNFDGNGCTHNDSCQNGTCTVGAVQTCDDNLWCTIDSCVSIGPNTFGCNHLPIAAGACFVGGVCYHTRDTDPANQCQQCSSGTTFTSKSDGTGCSDSNNCTVGDQCLNGTCISGPLRDCSDNNPCTADSCDPVTGDPVTGCRNIDLGSNCQRAEGFIGGGQHDCLNYNAATNTCTLSTPAVDVTIPVGALTTPTYVDVTNDTLSGTAGACGFALENTRNQVATCVQLEPSGTQFTTPVTATFKWTNQTNTTCDVSAVTPTGATTTVKEGTLSVYTQGTCVASHCDTTNAACATDANCVNALTVPCGTAGYTTSCPICPGTGCPAKATLDYPTCTSPCTTANIPASCNPGIPGGGSWTVQLTHFSPYALGSVAPPPDPFQCYRAVVINTTAVAAPVSLADHFGTVATTVRQPRSLCAPTNANGANPEAPAHADYLQSYPLRDARARAQFTPNAPRRNQQVLDQFGTHKLDLTSPDRLLVPTAENLTSPPDPLASTFVDHFTCYNVKASRGSARFQPVALTVTDAFALAPQSIKVQRPSRLCVPTDKNGEAVGAENNPWQLLCYHATRTFKQIGGVQTTNELGSSSVYPWAREEFCVPARIQ